MPRLRSCLLVRQGVLCLASLFLLNLVPGQGLSAPMVNEIDPVDSNGELLSPKVETWQDQKESFLLEMLPQQELFSGTKQLQQTLSLVQQGQYTQAQQQLEIFIHDNPGYGLAHEILGLVLLLQNAPDQAMDAFKRAVELEPRRSSALTKLGSLYMHQGQNDKAEQVLLKAVAINPQDRFANQRLGLLYEQSGNVEKAVSYFEQGVQGTPSQYIGVKVNLGILYNKQKRFSQTIALLGDLLHPETKNIVGHMVLGTAYLYTDQKEKALHHFQYAAAIDKDTAVLPLALAYRLNGNLAESKRILQEKLQSRPKDAGALFQLAETYVVEKEYSKALEYYRQAIDAGYPETGALRRMAALQMRQLRYQEAIQILDRIIASKGSVLEDQFVLSEAYQFSGHFPEAEKLLLALTKQHSQNSLVWYRLGLHYGLTRQYTKAVSALQRAKNLTAQNPTVLKALSMAYFQEGKKNEALQEAEQLYLLVPDNKDAAFFLASMYQNLGNTNEAKKKYQQILATGPPHGPTLNNLADLLAQSGDFQQASKLGQQAVLLDPENSRYRDTLGWIFMQMGKLDAAAAELEKAYAISPALPVIQYHLGRVYWQKGDMVGGKKLLQESIKDPKAPWVQEVKTLLEQKN